MESDNHPSLRRSDGESEATAVGPIHKPLSPAEIRQRGESLMRGFKEIQMQTRCKFRCDSVTKRVSSWHGGERRFFYSAEFAPVTGGSEENKQFFASTPGGQIRLDTIREDHFTPGQHYYIDFVPCEE